MRYHFIVIGVGGTGSLLARDLPKLFIGTDHIMTLVDGDHVEQKNLKRQSYQSHDIGENKAIALSKKINTFYSTKCFSVDQYIDETVLQDLMFKFLGYINVIIGCVDNDKTRKIIEDTVTKIEQCIYLDSANGEYEGNVYVCVKSRGLLKGPLRGNTYILNDDKHPSEISCEEAVSKGNTQFLITNNKMACVLLEHIYLLLNNKMKVGVTSVRQLEEIHT